ncbi:MAG: RNA polymerase sigma factor [Planctomycetota bacterium]|nr:RNA polymerase sigma factor [Planctomycetaceae bacterium]MDQ3329093.1 RNA polymerase sigma factor [Planctomycetota bacterium]
MTDQEGSSEEGRLDPAAVEALYASHAVELRAYLTGLLRDPDLAAEMLQATFLRAVERGHTFRNDSAKAWLFRVAHNRAMDYRRRVAAEGRLVEKSAWWKREKRGNAASPVEVAGRDETVSRVRQAIEQLPAEQRQIVRLKIYDNLTFAEIAGRLSVPLGTVLTRMRIATKKLSVALRGESKQ